MLEPFPETPGAHTQGAALDELRINLKEVLELCLESRGISNEEIPLNAPSLQAAFLSRYVTISISKILHSCEVMTTFESIKRRCGVCGQSCSFHALNSYSSFGPSDLDTRPPETARSTISSWIQRCPSCGYCARNVSKIEGKVNAKLFMSSDSYLQKIRSFEGCPDLACNFLHASLFEEEAQAFPKAGWSSVHAAWACDDADSKTWAIYSRKRAIPLFLKAQSGSQPFMDERIFEVALLTDLYRRTRQFKKAAECCDMGGGGEHDGLDKILQYMKILIQRKDSSCHTVEGAF